MSSQGIIDFRAGRHEKAVQLMEAELSDLPDHGRARVLCFLAMAYQKLGRLEDAKTALAEAEELMPSFGNPASGANYEQPWHDWPSTLPRGSLSTCSSRRDR